MAKAKLLFTERDVSRAIRAVLKTGLPVGSVLIDKRGNIIVEPGDTTPTPNRKRTSDAQSAFRPY
jgi:tRNA(Arg) A34 adenosine deaminase TadA